MPRLLWDASGLVKRYAVEVGTPTVMALWAAVPTTSMVATFPGCAEIYWILRRKRNRSEISEGTYQAGKAILHRELVASLDFTLIAVDTIDILAGLDLIDTHSLNSSDASILAAYLRYARITGEPCALIAADGRLCRAAKAEGLAVINPEAMPAADVPAFLAAL